MRMEEACTAFPSFFVELGYFGILNDYESLYLCD